MPGVREARTSSFVIRTLGKIAKGVNRMSHILALQMLEPEDARPDLPKCISLLSSLASDAFA
jgi:hypothetical protein